MTTPADLVRRGRHVGMIFAPALTIISICLMFLAGNVKANLSDCLTMALGMSPIPALAAVFVGSFLGEMAAKARTARIAFLRGTFYSALIAIASTLPFMLSLEIRLSRDTFILFCPVASLAALGSLVSGVSAIYVRDYRDFQRKRWLPQFTLQEMFIAFTLAGILFSAVACLGVFRR
jgi:hypothetical protein